MSVRELLVLRHGRAGEAPRDFDRPLTDVGAAEIARIRTWLLEEGCAPGLTVSSPAMRALTTAETAAGGPLLTDERIYDATASTLLAVLADRAEAPARVLLVGHNPGLSHLASFLSGRAIRLAPGSLVRLSMPASWRALESSCATLIHHVDAIDLEP